MFQSLGLFLACWRIRIAVVAVLLGCIAGCGQNTSTSPPEVSQNGDSQDDDDPKSGQEDLIALRATLATFNRGAALMEQYDKFSDAAKAFGEVVQEHPDWTAARFNYGLALLHTLKPDELIAARENFESILATDPDHLRARFCLGMYYQHVGELENAYPCFEAVYKANPNEIYAAYKFAEALRAADRKDAAIPILEKVVDKNPGLVSAVYSLAMLYAQSGMRDRAKPLFDRFKALKEVELNPSSYSVSQTYGMAGPYYRVLGVDGLPLPEREVPASVPIVFSPEVKTISAQLGGWDWGRGSIGLPGIAVADVDADGDLDLCLTASGDRGNASIWLNDGSAVFSASGQLADRVVSPCFGDLDNDGDADLWLGRAGGDLVMVNDGKGGFTPASIDSVAGPDRLTHVARLLDMDSDGDLDFVALRLAAGDVPVGGAVESAASSIFNSNGDGSFTDVASELSLAMPDSAISAFAFDDFDNDCDLDWVIFPADGAPFIWVNNRVNDYRLVDAESSGLDVDDVYSVTTGDPDKDGDRDLLVFTRTGIRFYENVGEFHFQSDDGFAAACGRLGGTGGQFADMDNDGDLDVIIADARRRDGSRGPALLINHWPKMGLLEAPGGEPENLLSAIDTQGDASCVVADFNGDGRNDVLLAAVGQQPVLIENATRGGHWFQLDLVGKRPKDTKSRSNNSAIGARVEVKTGAVYQQYLVGGSSGPVAMPPLRIHAGLGDSATVDWLRVIWPDGVLQSELELAANCVATIEEVNRKISSCPTLFAWDGRRFNFIADFGGVGGLGYLVAPGQYAMPDPTEYLMIPSLAPLDDQYVLQVVTQLEEITYFDEGKLLAIDHPVGTMVCPNEMMAISVPPPKFELFCFRDPIDPQHAVDHRGVDVTDELTRVDRRCAGATTLAPRFAGLANEHFVDLDFGDGLKGLSVGDRLILVMYGWVEYGYSSTNYAACQAGLQTRAPTIEVLRDGRWREVVREVGYPAGINHQMTVDVTGSILPGDRRIRISSNMELYWDRIFLAKHLPAEDVRLTEVAPASADLHFLGYPREYSPDGRHPYLSDYDIIDRSVGWKLMAGNYTRFGEVAELLDAADDCYVIMGHGEEITLRFPVAAFTPVPDGYQRTFVLKTDSYCKDMDLYTAFPNTVTPLPFHSMSAYPYAADESYPETEKTKQYREQYNTRRVGKD